MCMRSVNFIRCLLGLMNQLKRKKTFFPLLDKPPKGTSKHLWFRALHGFTNTHTCSFKKHQHTNICLLFWLNDNLEVCAWMKSPPTCRKEGTCQDSLVISLKCDARWNVVTKDEQALRHCSMVPNTTSHVFPETYVHPEIQNVVSNGSLTNNWLTLYAHSWLESGPTVACFHEWRPNISRRPHLDGGLQQVLCCGVCGCSASIQVWKLFPSKPFPPTSRRVTGGAQKQPSCYPEQHKYYSAEYKWTSKKQLSSFTVLKSLLFISQKLHPNFLNPPYFLD